MISVLPVPMRVDAAQRSRADARRLAAKVRFAGIPTAMTQVERDRYWDAVQIPYDPSYGYEECLATFGDPPGSTGTLLSHYERLTGYITAGEVTVLPALEEDLRHRVMSQFIGDPLAELGQA